MNPTTNRNSLRTLAKSIVNKLENKKFILIDAKHRNELQDELFNRLSRKVLTEEDINARVRSDVARVSEAITDQNITETEAYQSQKRAMKSKLDENAVQGFYLLDTLRAVSSDVCSFLFETKSVEDVFESDEAIQKLIMETVQTFDESKIA